MSTKRTKVEVELHRDIDRDWRLGKGGPPVVCGGSQHLVGIAQQDLPGPVRLRIVQPPYARSVYVFEDALYRTAKVRRGAAGREFICTYYGVDEFLRVRGIDPAQPFAVEVVRK